MEQGLWGVEVKSLDTGRVLYALNARKLMMPASNMKIVTLAAAAEALGWDYRFKTTLESDAEIEDGALKGDLDRPRRRRPDHQQPRQPRHGAVRRMGRGAQGRRHHPHRRQHRRRRRARSTSRGLGQGWSWDYLEAGYAAPSSALEFNENIATLTVRPGAKAGDAAQLELPPSTGLGLLHRVVTGEAGSRNDDQLRAACPTATISTSPARLPPTRSPRPATWRSRTRRSISLTR